MTSSTQPVAHGAFDAREAPAARHGTSPVPGARARSLASGITLDYGPRDLLAPFFLRAEEVALAEGVRLSFATLDELVAINRANSDSWRPILPIFDPRFGVRPENAFCIVGRDKAGEVVATQAGRLYTWTSSSFHEECESLRILYDEPEKHRRHDESMEVTAPAAKRVAGRVLFSGAVWNRRDHRGGILSTLLPRIGRAYALTRWSTDYTASFMAEGVVKGGVAARVGYRNVDWEIRMHHTPVWRDGTIRAALIWMNTDYLLSDLGSFARGLEAEVDPFIQYGAA